MERLLHHIDVITRQRHRGQLEASLAAAVRELATAEHVALYKLFAPPGDLMVGLAARATAAATELLDDGISWPAGTGPLAGFSHLQACHAHGGHHQDSDPDSGLRRHAFAIDGIDRQAFGFVVVHTRQPLNAATQVVVRGLLGLFRNCVALLDYSEIDTLTGLLNRKTFDEYLLRILSHVATEGSLRVGAAGVAGGSRRRAQATDHHWLGVIDLDHFKSINDGHGHLIGDEVLILAANLMKSAFRAHDKLFRFGGEEFVVLLKPAELASARAAFERCRREVEQYRFPQVGRVTVSAGFTRIGIYDTPSVILDNADEALYYAKGNGRNRVCCYEELIAAGELVKHHALNTDAVLF